MTEEFRPVVGYEGLYEVSNLGNVKTLRDSANKNAGEILKPNYILCYPTVELWKHQQGKNKKNHRLVAAAFIGVEPEGYEVAHLDGNPANSRLENLKYCTKIENSSHKNLHGTHIKGDRHPMAKFTNNQAAAIRLMYQELSPTQKRALEQLLGISESAARNISKGRRFPECLKVIQEQVK